MLLGREGFRGMAACVRALADELCEGRLALVLEGGYAASGLREGAEAVLEALLPEAPLPPHPTVKSGTSRTLDALVERVAAVHRERWRDLGAA
jgi:acetoin utilization deacetylase AcuC-like enzyme